MDANGPAAPGSDRLATVDAAESDELNDGVQGSSKAADEEEGEGNEG